jgi:hypothetical protein
VTRDRAATVRALEATAHTWLDTADRLEEEGDNDAAVMLRQFAAQEARQADRIVRQERR